MPLSASDLKTSLQALAASPGSTTAACAKSWADAMKAYASGLLPASTTVSAAASALETALATAFAAGAAAPGMETAFSSFAQALAAGMLPAFTGTKPAGSVGFAAQFASAFPATHADAALALSTKIDAWMRTGSAVSTSTGTTIAWS